MSEESINFSLDGSESTIELVLELYQLVHAIDRGDLTIPAEVTAHMRILLDNWETRQEGDQEVRTIIKQVIELRREVKRLKADREGDDA